MLTPKKSIHHSIRDVIVEPQDDEEFIDDDFEDTRMELKSCGHNLVSLYGITYVYSMHLICRLF